MIAKHTMNDKVYKANKVNNDKLSNNSNNNDIINDNE